MIQKKRQRPKPYDFAAQRIGIIDHSHSLGRSNIATTVLNRPRLPPVSEIVRDSVLPQSRTIQPNENSGENMAQTLGERLLEEYKRAYARLNIFRTQLTNPNTADSPYHLLDNSTTSTMPPDKTLAREPDPPAQHVPSSRPSKPMTIGLHSHHGGIMELGYHSGVVKPKFASVYLPDATLTAYHNGRQRIVQGSAFARFHYSEGDVEMKEIADFGKSQDIPLETAGPVTPPSTINERHDVTSTSPVHSHPLPSSTTTPDVFHTHSVNSQSVNHAPPPTRPLPPPLNQHPEVRNLAAEKPANVPPLQELLESLSRHPIQCFLNPTQQQLAKYFNSQEIYYLTGLIEHLEGRAPAFEGVKLSAEF